MGRIRRSPLHLLLSAAVVLATVFGVGVALSAARVAAPCESASDVEVEALHNVAAGDKSLRRAQTAPAGPFPVAVGSPRAANVPHLVDGRDAPPTRFLPASPGVLLLLCQFRC